jgi:hypothetical protein
MAGLCFPLSVSVRSGHPFPVVLISLSPGAVPLIPDTPFSVLFIPPSSGTVPLFTGAFSLIPFCSLGSIRSRMLYLSPFQHLPCQLNR